MGPGLPRWANFDARDATGARALRGGPEYAELHRAQRLLQDRLSGSVLPPDVSLDIAARLADISAVLESHQVHEHERRDGMRIDLPGRGHPVLPPYLVDDEDAGRVAGRVTFTRFFLGGNNAAHGGTLGLLFDDLLGRVANTGLAGIGRTASLTVDYRRIVPLDVELSFDAARDSVEGRKRWVSGRLRDAEQKVLCEARALFLELRPGQG